MDLFYTSSDSEDTSNFSCGLTVIVALFQVVIEFAVLDPCIKLVRWISPEEQDESSVTPTRVANADSIQGFPNLGLTCFLNATLEALRFTKSLQIFFQTTQTPERTLALYTKTLLQFQVLDQVETRHLLTEILALLPRFNDRNQHCAHSLFLNYVSVLDKELQTSHDLSHVSPRLLKYRSDKCNALHEMFSVLMENRFTCTKCWNGFTNYSYSRSLDVPIPNVCAEKDANVRFGEEEFYDYKICNTGAESDDVQHYYEMIRKFETKKKQKYPSEIKSVKSKTLDLSLKYLLRASKMTSENLLPCEHCLGSETQHIKQSFFRHIGSVLVLHFQRYDEATGSKDDSLVSYLPELDLTSFWKEGGKYDLYAVVLHVGSLSSGHYTANVKTPYGWRHFNDEYVSEVPESELVQQSAYILFYEKRI